MVCVVERRQNQQLAHRPQRDKLFAVRDDYLSEPDHLLFAVPVLLLAGLIAPNLTRILRSRRRH